MQQRVAIARALLRAPEILLMDEPFGALDAQTREVMHDLILHVFNLEKTTIVFVTHDVEEAIYLGQRVVLMAPRPGRIDSIYHVPLPAEREQDMKLVARVPALEEGDRRAHPRDLRDEDRPRAAAQAQPRRCRCDLKLGQPQRRRGRRGTQEEPGTELRSTLSRRDSQVDDRATHTRHFRVCSRASAPLRFTDFSPRLWISNRDRRR